MRFGRLQAVNGHQRNSSFTGLNTSWETLRPALLSCCAYGLSRSRVSAGEPTANEYLFPFFATNRKAVFERVRTVHPWAFAATTIASSSRSSSLCSSSIGRPRRDAAAGDIDCGSSRSVCSPSLAILFRMAFAAGPMAACRFLSLRFLLVIKAGHAGKVAWQVEILIARLNDKDTSWSQCTQE